MHDKHIIAEHDPVQFVEKLKALFTVSGTISFTITDIEADSEEDARDQVESELRAEFDGIGSIDWDVDITDTSHQ